MKQALCLALLVFGLASIGRAQDPDAESVPGSVLAHENVGDLLPHLGKEPLLDAVGAAGQAFALVNPILEQRGEKPLYCPPPKRLIEPAEYASILEQTLLKSPGLRGLPAIEWTSALLVALTQSFPCP